MITENVNIMPKTTQNTCKPKHCRNATMMKPPKKRNNRISMDFDSMSKNFQQESKIQKGKAKYVKSPTAFKDITLE